MQFTAFCIEICGLLLFYRFTFLLLRAAFYKTKGKPAGKIHIINHIQLHI